MLQEINISGPINNLGYGICCSNIVKELSKKIRVNLFPISKQITGNFSDKDLALFQKLVNNIEDADFSVGLKIWHPHDLHEHIGTKYFGWPIFELNSFTKQELSSLKSPDWLILCSKWAKQVIKEQTNREAFVVPLGVDTNIFSYSKSNKKTDTYNFYTMGKWEHRKGHDLLPDLFGKAFTKDDDVQLNMSTYNPFLNQQETQNWIDLYKNSKLGNKINIIPWQETQEDLVKLVQGWDCGLFVSRAEGWNLELLEAMACGKPVIITNYSAHTEYCTKENSYLVDINELETAYDNKWFFGQGKWAYIGVDEEDQIIEHMRYCYKNRPSNEEGVKTAKKFTWENSCNKLLEILNGAL